MALNFKKIQSFDIFNSLFMLIVIIIMLYPFWLIIVSSVSDPLLVMQNKIFLYPKGFTLINFHYVFSNNNIVLSFWNTIKYTTVGTAINIVVTVMMAYPLSRRRFTGRRIFMKIITFTLLFNGGIIPTYLLVKNLGIINTMWAIVLSGAVSTWNLIVTRTFMDGLPESLEESAFIDGANDIQILFKIFVPISAPIIATMTLFYAVAQWNNFFTPLIYLNDKEKYPLQIFLRSLLIQSNLSDYATQQDAGTEIIVEQSIKYTVIVVTTLPIILVYPFLQKYFVKGVMIGAVKA